MTSDAELFSFGRPNASMGCIIDSLLTLVKELDTEKGVNSALANSNSSFVSNLDCLYVLRKAQSLASLCKLHTSLHPEVT